MKLWHLSRNRQLSQHFEIFFFHFKGYDQIAPPALRAKGSCEQFQLLAWNQVLSSDQLAKGSQSHVSH